VPFPNLFLLEFLLINRIPSESFAAFSCSALGKQLYFAGLGSLFSGCFLKNGLKTDFAGKAL